MLSLALHLSFPVALTSDLAYKIWLNFKKDEQGHLMDIPLEGVGLILNAPICRNIGRDLYEIHEEVREGLQNALAEAPHLGLARMQRLARFLLAYTDHCRDKMPSRAFEQSQRWKAEAILHPARTAQHLLNIFARQAEKGEDSQAVDVYLSWIKHASGKEQGSGADYIHMAEAVVSGVRQYQQGNLDAARQSLLQLAPHIRPAPANASTRGFRTRLPSGILELLTQSPLGREADDLEQGSGVLYCLLAGLSKYEHQGMTELPGVANDVAALQQSLKQWYTGPSEFILLENEAATAEAILNEWRNLVEKANAEDQLLFYFGGHSSNAFRNNFLMTYEYVEGGEGGKVDEEAFRIIADKCDAFVTVVLDTHAGSDGWIDIRNNRHILFSATLPEQMAYEQRIEGQQRGNFSYALQKIMESGQYRSNQYIGRAAGQQVQLISKGQQSPIVWGAPIAMDRTFLNKRATQPYYTDLMIAAKVLPAESRTAPEAIEQAWRTFSEQHQLEKDEHTFDERIALLEKYLLFKDSYHLKIAPLSVSDSRMEGLDSYLQKNTPAYPLKIGAIRNQNIQLGQLNDWLMGARIVLLSFVPDLLKIESYRYIWSILKQYGVTYGLMRTAVLESRFNFNPDDPLLKGITLIPGLNSSLLSLEQFEDAESANHALIKGMESILDRYRAFIKRTITGTLRKDPDGWRLDKGREDGVSIWHRYVSISLTEGQIDAMPRILKVGKSETLIEATPNLDAPDSLTVRLPEDSAPAIYIYVKKHSYKSGEHYDTLKKNELNGIRWIESEYGADYTLHLGQTSAFLTLPFDDYRPLHRPTGFTDLPLILEQAFKVEYHRKLETPSGEKKVLPSSVQFELSVDRQWLPIPQSAGIATVEGELLPDNPTTRIRIRLVNNQSNYVVGLFSNYHFELATVVPDTAWEHSKLGAYLYFMGKEGQSSNRSRRTLDYNLPYEELHFTLIESSEPVDLKGVSIVGLPQPLHSENPKSIESYQKKDGTYTLAELPKDAVVQNFTLRIANHYFNRPDPEILRRLLINSATEPFARALYFESTKLAVAYDLAKDIRMEARSPSLKMSARMEAVLQGRTYFPDEEQFMEWLPQRATQLLRSSTSEEPLIIAIGDAWYNQAQPVDIASQLSMYFRTAKMPLGSSYGYSNVFSNLESVISSGQNIVFLISPGGKFLWNSLKDNVDHSSIRGDINSIAKPDFWQLARDLIGEWEKRLQGVGEWQAENVHFVVHAFDYFRPIAPVEAPLYKAMLYMVDYMNQELKAILDRLSIANLHYLDLRLTLQEADWKHPFIPNERGFQQLAERFRRFIEGTFEPLEETANYKGSPFFIQQTGLEETLEEIETTVPLTSVENDSRSTPRVESTLLLLGRRAQAEAYHQFLAGKKESIRTFVIIGREGQMPYNLVQRFQLEYSESTDAEAISLYRIPLSSSRNASRIRLNFWRSIYSTLGIDGPSEKYKPSHLIHAALDQGTAIKFIAFELSLYEWDAGQLQALFELVDGLSMTRRKGKRDQEIQFFFLLEYDDTADAGMLSKLLPSIPDRISVLPELTNVSFREIEDWFRKHLYSGQYSESGELMRIESMKARYFSEGDSWPMEEALYQLRRIMDDYNNSLEHAQESEDPQWQGNVELEHVSEINPLDNILAETEEHIRYGDIPKGISILWEGAKYFNNRTQSSLLSISSAFVDTENKADQLSDTNSGIDRGKRQKVAENELYNLVNQLKRDAKSFSGDLQEQLSLVHEIQFGNRKIILLMRACGDLYQIIFTASFVDQRISVKTVLTDEEREVYNQRSYNLIKYSEKITFNITCNNSVQEYTLVIRFSLVTGLITSYELLAPDSKIMIQSKKK
jgi:hypothetical protein